MRLSQFEKFKYTRQQKKTLITDKAKGRSNDVNTHATPKHSKASQDSDVTIIPETPSSEMPEPESMSPVFKSSGSSKDQHTPSGSDQEGSTSWDNSPTFSSQNPERIKTNKAKRPLLPKNHRSESPVYVSDDNYDGTIDQKPTRPFISKIHTRSKSPVCLSDSDDDDDDDFDDDDIKTDNTVGNAEKKTDCQVTVLSSDEEVQSPLIRSKKKRKLDPWLSGQENGFTQDSDETIIQNSESNGYANDGIEGQGLDEIDGEVESPLVRERKRRRIRDYSESFEEVVANHKDIKCDAKSKKMKKLREMFPAITTKTLQKKLVDSDWCVEIAAALVASADESAEAVQSNSEEEELPNPFGKSKDSSNSKVKNSKKKDVKASLTKFAYNGDCISKRIRSKNPPPAKSNKKSPPAKTSNQGGGAKKSKSFGNKGKGRSSRRLISSSDEEEGDNSFVVNDTSIAPDAIDDEEEEEEEEEEESEAEESEEDDSGEEMYEEFSERFKVQLVSFFSTASVEELQCVNGISKKKAQAIIRLRPFSDFDHVLKKLDDCASLSSSLIGNCEETFEERQSLRDTLDECSRISTKIHNSISEQQKREEAKITQPELLNQSLTLKPYQLVGVSWMLLLHKHGVNGILADEMGLGKTIQVIAFLAKLMSEGEQGPHAIIVPSSTLDNWRRELHRWCPAIEVVLYCGSQEQRAQIRDDILSGYMECNVIVTSYNICISKDKDRSFFNKLGLKYTIFDEGHMLKNIKTQRFQSLLRIKAKRKLLLTGTPLQNNLLELMALISFTMPDMIDGKKAANLQKVFSSVTAGKGEDQSKFVQERILQAKQIMQPFVLRRVKCDVLDQLPAKIVKIERCPMAEHQQELYQDLKHTLSQDFRKLQSGNEDMSAKKINSAMMELRKLANHPLLLRHLYTDKKLEEMSKLMLKEPTHRDADAKLICEDMEVMNDFELHRLCCQYYNLYPFRLQKEKILQSGKFEALDKVLPQLFEEGVKVLLFSQFVIMLDIVEAYMQERKYRFLRLDGQTPVNERGALIDKFSNDEDYFVFLLSTRAGGLGINLTAASTVVLHDIDFNPYNDKQAEDRCHRVGQTKEVTVIKLVSEGSIDETMLQRANFKLNLEKQMTSDDFGGEDTQNMNIAALMKQALGIS